MCRHIELVELNLAIESIDVLHKKYKLKYVNNTVFILLLYNSTEARMPTANLDINLIDDEGNSNHPCDRSIACCCKI